ncbi:efflux RND transporter periplasmic adaptor subunit [Desulfosporosinus meridiei]|uniref:Multidrug resistance efflux pump n=1 Tax=Desulfosporosinus meridiei (strain ATCC BAA-275 / DSM 13257 / KCTC 12902 / NCIMB 13706 / S10) TaxID=768704 RepID=J7IUC8_DESMD|nr:HlyD family efflux transporter periplasmic adaptor subunit [Desulfosporosinus meridiei]AFQ45467.1 multidrug resistance efflux pump [Desulfosporosinus meridiei DSM 13257]
MVIEKAKFNQTPNRFKFPRFKNRKLIIFGGLAFLILISVTISKVMPLAVEVITLQPNDFSKGFTEEGEVMAAKEWPIFNPVEGKLESLKVKNGESVKKGQVLLEMSTSDLNYQLEGLRAQLQSLEGQRLENYKSPDQAQIAQQTLLIQLAEKDAQTEEQNLVRQKALYEAGSIARVQYEEAERTFEKAKNFLEQQKLGLQLIYEQHQTSQGTELYYSNQKKALQAQIDQLEEKISDAVVVAQQDGFIKDLSLKEGNVIPQGQQIMTVFINGGYNLESYVLASDALDIKVGSPVQVIQETSSGKKSFEGTVNEVAISAVEKISPLGLKENRVKVTIQLSENSPSVVLGSNVDVMFTTLEVPDQLMIPKTALFPYQEGDAVWIVREGKAKIQPVKKGLENDSQVTIEEGLSEGDQVLQDPNLKELKEGKRLKG